MKRTTHEMTHRITAEFTFAEEWEGVMRFNSFLPLELLKLLCILRTSFQFIKVNLI